MADKKNLPSKKGTALFIGRFQPFHSAHLEDIRKILIAHEKLIIGIGSSNIKRTPDNPLSYEERISLIKKVLSSERLKGYSFFPVPDFGNDEKWVDYIHNELPDFGYVYSGNKWTLDCFRKHGEEKKAVQIELIPDISSTIVRKKIIQDKGWEDLMPRAAAAHLKKKGFLEIIRQSMKE